MTKMGPARERDCYSNATRRVRAQKVGPHRAEICIRSIQDRGLSLLPGLRRLIDWGLNGRRTMYALVTEAMNGNIFLQWKSSVLMTGLGGVGLRFVLADFLWRFELFKFHLHQETGPGTRNNNLSPQNVVTRKVDVFCGQYCRWTFVSKYDDDRPIF